MAKASESAFPGAGRWRPCQRRRVRRADRRETRGEPTYGQRASEDFVASRIAALQTDQAMDVLQTRRSPHREAEAGDRCENLMRGEDVASRRPHPEGHREAMRLLSSRRVGKAKRAHHSRSRSHQWWARRKGRLCPPIRSHTLRMREDNASFQSNRPKAAAAPRFQPRDPRPFSGSASHAVGSAGYSLRDWQGWSVPRLPMRSPWLPRRTAARSDENTIADRGTRYPAEPGSV